MKKAATGSTLTAEYEGKSMFCFKCGEVIPDGSLVCPKCGASLEGSNDQAVVYVSQEEINENHALAAERVRDKSFYIWCAFALLSFAFLALNYLHVSVRLYYSGSSDTDYSGYGLLGCLKGTVSVSGYMVILLIIVNLAVFLTGILGAQGTVIKKNILKIWMMLESIAYLIVTIVPYFNIKKALEVFDSDISATGIGVGCYLNIVLAVVAVIYYLACFYKKLSEE